MVLFLETLICNCCMAWQPVRTLSMWAASMLCGCSFIASGTSGWLSIAVFPLKTSTFSAKKPISCSDSWSMYSVCMCHWKWQRDPFSTQLVSWFQEQPAERKNQCSQFESNKSMHSLQQDNRSGSEPLDSWGGRRLSEDYGRSSFQRQSKLPFWNGPWRVGREDVWPWGKCWSVITDWPIEVCTFS